MPEVELSDKELIEAGGWATCYICRMVFRRKRETLRYCGQCNHGYCEGEHGSFALRSGRGGAALCIICSSGGEPTRLAH